MSSVHFFVAASLLCHVTSAPINSIPCGIPAIKPDTSRIVGGRDVVPYSWPWHAAVIRWFKGKGKYHCGGSLVSDQWILSAAHCFHGISNHVTYEVRLGVFQQNSKEGKVVQVKRIHVHPMYHTSTLVYDAALLELSEKINITGRVSPVCLPSGEEDMPRPNAVAYVTGWGRTSSGSWTISTTLKQVDVVIYSSERCEDFYGQHVYTDVMFCAGFDQGGKDSCQGDSGGPLVVYDFLKQKWVQMGIVSWGFGCAQPSLPGVYSKLSKFLTWVNDVTSTGYSNQSIDLPVIDRKLFSSNIDLQLEEQSESETIYFPKKFNISLYEDQWMEIFARQQADGES